MIRPLKVREYWAALRSSRRFSRLSIMSCSKTWRARSSCATVWTRSFQKLMMMMMMMMMNGFVLIMMLTAIASSKWGSYSGEPWCRFCLNGVRFSNSSGKAKRTHTVDPSLRAASSFLDRISFRMLVREYCAASSSCSEGMPLYRKDERNFVFQKGTQTRGSVQGRK